MRPNIHPTAALLRFLSAPPVRIEADAATDRGCVRDINEDRVFADVEAGVFCVADGLGGGVRGGEASDIVVEEIRKCALATGASDALPSAAAHALAEANLRVWGEACRIEQEGHVGATVVCLCANAAQRTATVLSAGDSRLYHFHQAKLRQVTEDHTPAWRSGIRTRDAVPELYRGVLSRFVGQNETLPLDRHTVRLDPGDVLLLCSDGLNEHIPDRATRDGEAAGLEELLTENACNPLSQAARLLIFEAKQRGGEDNISAVLVRVEAPLPGQQLGCRIRRAAAAVALVGAVLLLGGAVRSVGLLLQERKYRRLLDRVSPLPRAFEDRARAIRLAWDETAGLGGTERERCRGELRVLAAAEVVRWREQAVDAVARRDWARLRELSLPDASLRAFLAELAGTAAVEGVTTLVGNADELSRSDWRLSRMLEEGNLAGVAESLSALSGIVRSTCPGDPVVRLAEISPFLARLPLESHAEPQPGAPRTGGWPWRPRTGSIDGDDLGRLCEIWPDLPSARREACIRRVCTAVAVAYRGHAADSDGALEAGSASTPEPGDSGTPTQGDE